MRAEPLRRWLLITALSATASPAFAQDPPPAQDAVEPPAGYTDLIEEGLSESSMQHWAEARAIFRRAHAMFPNARTLRAIGMTSFELRDYPEAYRMFVASLADPRRPLTDAQRAEVQSLLERTVSLLGRYSLEGYPDDAVLRVDGVETVLTAGDELVLPTGTHRVELRTASERWFGEWTVQGGEQRPLPVTHVDPLASLPTAAVAPASRMSAAQRRRYVVGSTTAFAGLVLAGAGTGVALRGRSAIDRVDDAPVGTAWSSLADDYDEGPRKVRVGLAFVGVGVAAIGAGLTLLVLRPDADADVALRLGPGTLETEVRFGIRPLVVSLVLLAACVPDLESGRYACVDGLCPDEFVCRANELCYAPDAPASPIYSLCDENAECDTGLCTNHPSMLAVDPGLCTRMCTRDDECVVAGAPSGICTMNMCFRTCGGADDCAGESRCVETPGRPGTNICVRVEDPLFEGTVGCDDDGDCRAPTRCRTDIVGEPGICAWPCGDGTECPGNSECRPWPGQMPMRICVRRCVSHGECTGSAICAPSEMPNVTYCGDSDWTYPL